MFSYIEIETKDYNMIGVNSSLKGDFQLSGESILCGEISGTISMKDDSLLRIERQARVSGKIFAQNILIDGWVEGEITSKGKVTLSPTAQFSGQIKAQELDIHPGAIVNMEAKAEKDKNPATRGTSDKSEPQYL